MTWQPEIDEITRRMRMARQMGGAEGVDVQHSRGKLTIRERLDALCDAGSFQEIGRLAGTATYAENGELEHVQPSNTIIGQCTLDGRKVVLNGGDFTVRGGASDATIGNKAGHAQNMARDWKLPYIRLLDASGGSVKASESAQPCRSSTKVSTSPMLPTPEPP